MPSKRILSTIQAPNGFTLIELLVVVTILGILAGIVVSIINPTAKRNQAKDGVRVATLSKIAQAIEAFYVGENTYPANEAATYAAGTQYVTSWPDDADISMAAEDYRYVLYTASSVQYACVSIKMATVTSGTNYFKYVNPYLSTVFTGWSGASPAGKILRNCTSSCSSGSLTGCVAI